MDAQSEQDEQHSFQALKNKWAQQASKQEQPLPHMPTTVTSVTTPPPIPPKPSSVSLPKVHAEEERAVNAEDQIQAREDAAKSVSLLSKQFEVTPGNFSTSSSTASLSTLEKPPRAIPIVNKKTPAPPPPPPASILVASPPQIYHRHDPFSHPVQAAPEEQDIDNDDEDEDESSDGDSDTEEEDEKERQAYVGKNIKEGDNNLIEQVQKAHLQYTKLEESRYIGAPGVRSHDSPSTADNKTLPLSPLSSKSHKKPPPPPPPSKKYHRSAAVPTQPATPNIPMTINPLPATAVDTTVVTAPPILPPRPMGSPMIPQLPPRPSQSTLARAHTIASHSNTTKLAQIGSPSSIYTDSSSLAGSDYEDDSRISSMKRANTVSVKRALSRNDMLMTSCFYPDFSKATRNPPRINMDQKPFSTGHKGSVQALAASKNLILSGSHVLRTWDINTGTVMSTIAMDTNNNNNNQNNNEGSNDRIRAVIFAPSRIPVNEGRYAWVARHDTMLAVVDVRAGGTKVLSRRNDVHSAPILFLLRYGNSEIWSIDDSGVLNVWDVVSADYQQQNPLLTAMPRRYHVTSHAIAATIYGSKLWMSSGRTLVAHPIPVAGSQLNSNEKSQTSVRIPNDMGNITKLLTIPYHPYRIFASHDDGKISIWDTEKMERVQVITVSMYGICTMACVGEYHVWAGYNTGMIYVYDTRPEKWAVLKMWKAHTGAVTQLVVDESSLILDEIKGKLQVVSSDSNGFVGVWDGLLTDHWKEDHLNQRADEYCTYDDARVMICSWNIDASKPERIVGEDDTAVREWLGTMEDPDIIVVGIQEIVDLESKKQTARSLFSRKKTDPTEAEDVLTHRYKLWHDYLIRIIGENYGHNAYTVIKTDQLVGLFSCIFVRTSDMDRVFDVDSTSVKTGLKVMNKSIHGNKGGIAIRFVYDHSSLCFVNCHLAAGQSHVQQRNADAEGILQSATFPRHDYADVFSHGGDGTMILDHEFCFLSGDLNYRIKMSRNDVLKILASPDKPSAWEKLRVEDQLLRQNINNPLFKLLHFEEAPINFDPTYKYDPGTDFYDRSEKKRVPAWCDRVLFKGNSITNLYYRRYEPRCSDHRPIGAGFKFRTKVTDQKKRDHLMLKIEEEWKDQVSRFIKDKKAKYVADYEQCTLNEAFKLLENSDWDVNDTVIKLLNTT